MKKAACIPVLLFLALAGCMKEYDCSDEPLRPFLIGYTPAETDTLVLLKYKPADDFRTLLDTATLVVNKNMLLTVLSDTTIVLITDEKWDIKAGFDWQLVIPAINQTVRISDINAEKATGKCNSGIFSMDKFGCGCVNRIFSVTVDGLLHSFPDKAMYAFPVRK